MKRIKTLALTCLMALAANAQSDPGTFSVYPRLGLNISKFTNNSIMIREAGYQGTDHMKPRAKQGINVGADIQYQVTDNFAVSLGAMYSMEGSNFTDVFYGKNDLKETYEYTDQQMELHYINVPLMAIGYIGESGFAVMAGVQLGFLANASQEYNINALKKVGDDWHINTDVDGKYSQSATSMFNRMNVSIPVGISYEFYNVSIDARYNFGLTKLYKDDVKTTYPDINKVKNNTFEFIVGYKFEL